MKYNNLINKQLFKIIITFICVINYSFAQDTDNDGLTDADETNIYGTSPNNPDSDFDFLTDGYEVLTSLTNPLSNDSDADGLNDYYEIYTYFTNPNLADSDGDGYTDIQEINTTQTNPNLADTDADGLNDYYENNTSHTYPLVSDTDNDGLNDGAEINLATNPLNPDSDGDGYPDGYEVNTLNTNPINSDTDGDSLSDFYELNILQTNPNLADTDADGYNDDYELYNTHTDPLLADSDNDGINDYYENNTSNTNPLIADSDYDGLLDGYEVNTSFSSPLNADSDSDGLTDYYEVNTSHTNPNSNDSDNDGFTDYYEINISSTNPNLADTDNDGLNDYYEINTSHTNPNSSDSDGDTLSDGYEVNTSHTNPLNSDSDNDTLSDNYEINTSHTNPLLTDSDSDGIPDATEINSIGTNPNNADSDNDGLNDYYEIYTIFTNALISDTDSDNLSDGSEVNTYHSNPLLADSDLDGIQDDYEVLVSHTSPTKTDSDTDGLSDWQEVFNYLTNPNNSDSDADGLSDFDEINYSGTNPLITDCDSDGLTDGEEINTYFTNPLVADSDADGLRDDYEVLTSHTNPNKMDSDSDGINDWMEISIYFTNPNLADSDYDGLTDISEIDTYNTNPLNSDCDSDGLIDGLEVNFIYSNPLVADTDADGLNDGFEYNTSHSNPHLTDTDSDGLTDLYEVVTSLTSPNNVDTDADTLSDYYEINTSHTNPLVTDTDADGLSDGYELNTSNSNPFVVDTDSDGLSDGYEVNTSQTNPLLTDTDSDTLNDYYEINTSHTNPLLADTDNDGLTDYQEFEVYHTIAINPDSDNDTLFDGYELFTLLTNPMVGDTDGDNLYDGYEVNTSFTSPVLYDTDFDNLNDGYEWNTTHTSPVQLDTDFDGLSDYYEIIGSHTNPTHPDSDGDGLTDGTEILTSNTNPLLVDTDGDTLWDGYEVNTSHTNPLLVDTDGDGMSDDYEINTNNTLPNDHDNDGVATNVDCDDNNTFIGSQISILSTSPAYRCGVGSVSLSATCDYFGNVKWYDAPTAGNLIATGNFFTTPALSTSTTYYVEATNGVCTSSPRTPITATINISTPPTVLAQNFCGTVFLSNLTPAPSATIKWYSNQFGGGTLGNDTVVNTGTYWVSATDGTGCESDRVSASITVNETPDRPIGSGFQIYTGNKTLNDLSITGTNLRYYDALTGGNLLPNSNSLVNDSTYYITQTNSGGCESDTRLSVRVNKIGEDNQTLCTSSTIGNLANIPISGATVSWFNANAGGTALDNNTSLLTGNYYVEAAKPSSVTTLENYYYPYYISIDKFGNRYISDYYNHFIKKEFADGSSPIYSTQIGNFAPHGSALDSFGNLYVIDDYYNQIIKFNSSLNTSTVIKSEVYASAIAINQQNEIYVASIGAANIIKMDLNGNNQSTVYSGVYPSGMAIDKFGKIYFTQAHNNYVFKMNADGSNFTSLGNSFNNPKGIAVDDSGSIYIGECLSNVSLKRMDNNGANITVLVTGSLIESMAIDADQNVYFTENQYSGTIKKYTRSTITNRVAVGVNIISTTPTPTASDQVFCVGATVANLVATGTDLKWYNVATNGTALINSTVLTTGVYYVSQTENSCESTRTSINVTINTTPLPAVLETYIVYNLNDIMATLSATGTNLLWYTTAVGGTGTSTAPTPSSTTAGITSYWVSQTANGCESNRVQIDVAVSGSANYLQFSGASNHITFTNPQNIPIMNSSYTIEAWIKPASQGANGIAGWGQYGSVNQVNAFRLTETGLVNYWFANDLFVNYTFTLNTWYHVAVTYDGVYRIIYVNGVEVGFDNPTPNSHFVPHANNLRIGSTGYGEFFSGGMDEVRIWNRALSQSELQAKMNCELAAPSSETGLVGYYKFNQGIALVNNTSINTLIDSSPSGNTGELNNFSLNGPTSNWAASSIITTTTPPTANSQYFCGNATIADLVATGTNLRWYDSASSISSLSPETALSTGTYYVSQTLSTCESTRTAVAVSAGTTTTWNGTSWSNGSPTSNSKAVFAGNYSEPTDLTACCLEVTGTALVSIPSGYTISVSGAVTVAPTASLTFNNNANLIQTATTNTNSGNVVVKRNSNALMLYDYTAWSSPVANQNLLSFSPQTAVARFYSYNTTTNFYNVINPSNNSFATANGYLIRVPANHPTIPTVWNGVFTGVPNSGDISFSVSTGFNLIGNPYPSPISMSQFLADNANIDGTFYFWRKTNNANNTTSATPSYCTYAGYTFVTNGAAGASDPNGIIETGQGFIVNVTSGTALNFNNGQRNPSIANRFFKTKNIEYNRIWLNASNTTGAFSQMAVGYITNATQGVDAFDGKYMNDGAIALTTTIEADYYTIQGRALPFDGTDVVPMSFSAKIAGDYTIAIDHIDGLFSGNQDIILFDNTTGTETDLKAEVYNFKATVGVDKTRFTLKFQRNLAINNSTFDKNGVVFFKNKSEISIKSSIESIASVKMFDINGRLLFEKSKINAKEYSFDGAKFANQVLIVKITTQNGTLVTKKVEN